VIVEAVAVSLPVASATIAVAKMMDLPAAAAATVLVPMAASQARKLVARAEEVDWAEAPPAAGTIGEPATDRTHHTLPSRHED